MLAHCRKELDLLNKQAKVSLRDTFYVFGGDVDKSDQCNERAYMLSDCRAIRLGQST